MSRGRAGTALLVLGVLAAPIVAPTPADAALGGRPYDFAVIGDIPYEPAQEAQFPGVVDQINADRGVRLVAHLGDIKSGSTPCSDQYFDKIRAEFDRFEDPLVYTPGDNEWTDCHRPNNGGYNPIERLQAIRDRFFDAPGSTLGQNPARVISQADGEYPENVRFARANVAFVSVHVVGSNNGLAPWTGNAAATPKQNAEVLGRTAAVVALIKDSFAAARENHNSAVVLLTQADMFDPTNDDPTFDEVYGFQPIVETIARESAAFAGSVYLINGDSHVYNVDRPLAAGSPWGPLYDIGEPVDNLTRITVDGAGDADNYLRVTVHRRGNSVLSWTRVPFDDAGT